MTARAVAAATVQGTSEASLCLQIMTKLWHGVATTPPVVVNPHQSEGSARSRKQMKQGVIEAVAMGKALAVESTQDEAASLLRMRFRSDTR